MATIRKTEALVLRVVPFSTTSHVVTWFTPAQGKIGTVVKGACRPKSLFLGQYDLFYTCELLFYARERNGLHIAKECAPLATRPRFRSDWRAFCIASYICSLLARVVVSGSHQAELYGLATTTLDHLCSCSRGPQIAFWFELKALGLLGLAPQLGKCSSCGHRLAGSGRSVFSCAQGGMICGRCSARALDQEQVTPDVLAILRRWQDAADPRVADTIRCTPDQLLAFRRILGIFIGHYLDVGPENRSVTLEMASP
jgi:DNA repair protein RecO (recombination protein O)